MYHVTIEKLKGDAFESPNLHWELVSATPMIVQGPPNLAGEPTMGAAAVICVWKESDGPCRPPTGG